MPFSVTCSSCNNAVILAVFVLAVIVSGIPRVEIHAHKNAYFGHVHVVDIGQHHDERDNPVAQNSDKPGGSDTLHVHDSGMSAEILFLAEDLAPDHYRYSTGGIPPPAAGPPDRIVAPLYRPPIV